MCSVAKLLYKIYYQNFIIKFSYRKKSSRSFLNPIKNAFVVFSWVKEKAISPRGFFEQRIEPIKIFFKIFFNNFRFHPPSCGKVYHVASFFVHSLE